MRVYFDTSALVPLYVPEELSAAATERLEAADAIYVSWLTKTEIASALALKTRTGRLDTDAARRVLDVFHHHLGNGALHVLPVQQEVFDLATRWIERFETPLRTLDALHLACAHRLDLTLITADSDLARSANHFDVPCDDLSCPHALDRP